MNVFKYVGLSIVAYLFLFYLSQLINPPISWLLQNLIVTFIIIIGIFKLVPGNPLKKISLGIVSIFIAFTISFIYSNIALGYASDLCSNFITQKMEKENIENKIDANGFPTVVNLTDQCAGDYLPFPWFSKPKI